MPDELPKEDPYLAIKEKYNNDIDQVAKALKSMQSEKDKLFSQHQPPEEYEVASELKDLGESYVEALVSVAKEGKYTQPQFDALTSKISDFEVTTRETEKKQAETLKEARQKALEGSKETLKSFYTAKLPTEVLDSVLENGTPEQIASLKQFREQNLGGKTTPPLGENMTTTTVDKTSEINKSRQRLIEIAAKLPYERLEAQNTLKDEQKSLAMRICELKKQS